MRNALTAQARGPSTSWEKLPPPAEPGRSFPTRGAAERPTSIREAIIRWLNEEL